MREILFRGKRIDNGEWVEGYYKKGTVIAGDRAAYIADIILEAPTKPFGDGLRSEVESATVGQYTGLQDKNGQRIFEGDICRICLDPEICTAVVEYREDIASFIWRCNEKEMLLPLDYSIARDKVGDAVWVEVIGNIHDNPELLAEHREKI